MNTTIAVRNVFRNRRRTVFSLLVISVGVTILAFVLGFVGEALESTKRSLAMETGAIQIGDARVLDGTAPGLERLITPEFLDRVVEIARAEPQVMGLTWQLRFSGLIGGSEGSTLLIARGVIPEDCMDEYMCLIVDGAPLREPDGREILLGERLAASLGLSPGDRINIATGTVAGAFNAATVTVAGTLRYSDTQTEERLGLVPLGFAQRLLRTNGVERVLIRIDDLDAAPQVAASLALRLEEAGIPLATRTWQELNPLYDSLSVFWSAFAQFAALAVFVLVFFSVLEVLTISFLERIREVATVRALGTSRLRVFGGLVTEGAVIGLLGGLLGALAGGALAGFFNALGIAWIPPGGAMPQPIRVAIGPATLLLPLVTAVAATLVSSLYPASKNARLTVAEALRSI